DEFHQSAWPKKDPHLNLTEKWSLLYLSSLGKLPCLCQQRYKGFQSAMGLSVYVDVKSASRANSLLLTIRKPPLQSFPIPFALAVDPDQFPARGNKCLVSAPEGNIIFLVRVPSGLSVSVNPSSESVAFPGFLQASQACEPVSVLQTRQSMDRVP
ncbi:membrane dipeptidase, partial [Striga asiatica]